MNENNTVNSTQQETTTQPEGNGTGKTFTQEEVNHIVQERLSRVKDAAAEQNERTAALDKREADIQAREAEMQRKESRAACAEICKKKDFDETILDLLDTSDPEKFEQLLEILHKKGFEAYKKTADKAPKFMRPTGSHGSPAVFDPFKPKKGLF